MSHYHGIESSGQKNALTWRRTIEALLAFRRERDWEQFHTLKNLAIAISVEAAELLEQFQWTADHTAPLDAAKGPEKIRAEIADIAILLTYLTHDLGIDLDAAVTAKLAINARRYPVEKSRGSAAKWDVR